MRISNIRPVVNSSAKKASFKPRDDKKTALILQVTREITRNEEPRLWLQSLEQEYQKPLTKTQVADILVKSLTTMIEIIGEEEAKYKKPSLEIFNEAGFIFQRSKELAARFNLQDSPVFKIANYGLNARLIPYKSKEKGWFKMTKRTIVVNRPHKEQYNLYYALLEKIKIVRDEHFSQNEDNMANVLMRLIINNMTEKENINS